MSTRFARSISDVLIKKRRSEMKYLLAPLYSFFSVKFYRSLLSAPLFQGIIYVLCLSFLMAMMMTIAFGVLVKPIIDEQAQWFIEQIPELTLTPEGIQANVAQPYFIRAQDGSVIGTINTAEGAASEADMTGVLVYVTKEKVYIRQSEEDIRPYDIVDDLAKSLPEGQTLVITQDTAAAFYKTIMRWSPIFVFIMSLLLILAWKMIAAFIYSVVAIILNLFRKPRLSYSALFNITVCAMTPIWVLQILALFLTFLAVSFNLWASLIVTVAYQAIFIFLTRSSAPVDTQDTQS